jgi:hypothetical protein
MEGSGAVAEVVPSFEHNKPGRFAQRDDLIESGVLAVHGDAYRFTQDYVFTSPSTAATIILGRSTNGRTKWRDAQGRTLKELQEADTAQA